MIGLMAAAAAFSSQAAHADEAGSSFWVPGLFGSLAAAPQVPGWNFTNFYYHTTVSGGSDVVFAREVPIGHLNIPFTSQVNAHLNADADLDVLFPQYVFATPVLGGQAAVGLLVPVGRMTATADATLTAAVGPLGFTVGAGRTDESTGFGDPAPFASLRWHDGVNNWMTYITGGIPVGEYSATSLANLGLGHGSIDAGGGYTYFNPATGHEFSGVLGFTYNFINPDTQVQSGVDMHFDWGASQFLTKQWQIGVVGYVYKQISCDSGSGNRVGCFESQVVGMGPQIGYIIPMGKLQGYLNLKAYAEFDSAARPEGWNTWITFAISEAPPTPASPSHLLTK